MIGRLGTLISTAALLGGCYGPPPPLLATDPPELRKIQDSFSAAVSRAHTSDEQSWHSGWYGNILVNVGGGDNRGLCWQWQQMVYDGTADKVWSLGWEISGVALDVGTGHEHHAVMVWDPKVIERGAILVTRRPRRVWILDGWRRGEADLWPLDQWLDSTTPFPDEIHLEKLWVRNPPAGTSPVAEKQGVK